MPLCQPVDDPTPRWFLNFEFPHQRESALGCEAILPQWFSFKKKGWHQWLVFIGFGVLSWFVTPFIGTLYAGEEWITLNILIYPWHSFLIRSLMLLIFLVTGILVAKTSTKIEATEQKLAILHEWARKLNQASRVDTILEYTMNAMKKTLGFENAFIALKHDTMLKVEKCEGIQIPAKFREIPIDEEILGAKVVEALQEGKSVLIKDLSKHPEYFSVAPQIKSKLGVGIKTEQEIIGVLEVGSEEIAAFDKRDQRLLEILSSHVAVAIKEQREKKQRVSLERLDTLRNRFIAMVTHDISSPLTPIKAELEMLQQGYYGDLRREQRKGVQRILEKVDRLTRLVDDFRRTSKLRSERIPLEKDEHRLVDTVEKALEGFQNTIIDEDILLIKDFQQPLTMIYDEDRMVQVLRNLIKNAMEYTEDKIEIRGRENADAILISVEDNGSGIPKKEQEKIFEPFYQVKESKRETHQNFSSGLGLYICKQIIDAHNGEITIDSVPGEGATFTIHLPKEHAQ